MSEKIPGVEPRGPALPRLAVGRIREAGLAMGTNGIRFQVGTMNYNIGRPVSQMTSFMPGKTKV